MDKPLVDVIVPVHTPTRPIARAVGSVVSGSRASVRVSVVVHNTEPEGIRLALGAWANHAAVRLIPFEDGIASPAGPMNHGLDLADAPFTSILGSDDEFQPGAIDSWLARQREAKAGFVIARIIHEGRAPDAWPPVRRSNPLLLDGVRDRLSYRSAPLGLIDRAIFGHLRFTRDLATGEDLEFVTRMWFSGERITFDLEGPGYYGHHDETDRVSFARRSFDKDFAFLDLLLEDEWTRRLPLASRRAFAVKMIRTQVFDAVGLRALDGGWDAEQQTQLEKILNAISTFAPGTTGLLSVADRRILRQLFDPASDPAELLTALSARWQYARPKNLVAANPLLTLHRQAPFRTLWAGFRVMNAPKRI